MSKWEKVRLGDIGIFRTGGTPSRANPDFFQGNIPWITTVSLGKKIIDKNDAVEFISEEALKKSSAKLIKAKSVMVGIRVGVGKSSINAVEMATNQDIVSIEDIDEKLIYKPYLLYFLNSCYQLFSSQQRGATIQGISSAVLKNLMVPIPPLNIQKQIAHELDTVSELLALRKHQLEELDQLIKSVFYEMFGDPVANEKGWKICALDDLITNLRYGTSTPPIFSNSGYCFIRATNIKSGRIIQNDMRYIDSNEAKKLEKCKLAYGDIIIVRSGVNTGDSCVVLDEYTGHYAGYDIIVSPNLSKINSVFINELLNTTYMERIIKPLTRRAAQPHLNAEQVKNLPIITPPLSFQEKFAKRVFKIESQKSLVRQSVDETQRLFDSLMSQYFDD